MQPPKNSWLEEPCLSENAVYFFKALMTVKLEQKGNRKYIYLEKSHIELLEPYNKQWNNMPKAVEELAKYDYIRPFPNARGILSSIQITKKGEAYYKLIS